MNVVDTQHNIVTKPSPCDCCCAGSWCRDCFHVKYDVVIQAVANTKDIKEVHCGRNQ